MGSQFVKIALQADVGSFVSGFSQADSAAGKFGATVSGLTRVGQAVGSALDLMAQKAQTFAKHTAAAGSAGVLFFGGLALSAAKLEVPLRNVQTLMGGDFGADKFNQMRDSVVDLSRKLPQSATDLANGLYNIASSGFYGSDALKVLNVSATAATAGLTTTQNASTAITASLNAYGKTAKDAADMSDIMFQTVNLGVITFEQLTGVIGDTVGTAAAAKVGFDQVGSAIATMTLSGISAEESGTSLNRLLQSIIKPSDALAGALNGLGYESGASALQTDGLYKVMMKLMKASQGNIGTLLQWFPEIRAARGALALMSAEGQNYARVAGEIENKNNRVGATQRAFAIQSEGAMLQFQKFVNGIKAAGLEVGRYFLPAATIMLKFATTIVDAFGSIPGPIKMAIGWVGALGSALLALAGIYAMFVLKSAVTRVAMAAIGRAAQGISPYVGRAGAAFTDFGNRAQNLQAPFAVTRTFLGTTGTLFNTFGQHISGAGAKVQEFGSHMTWGGQIVSGFGTAMTKASSAGSLMRTAMGGVASGVAKLVGYAPAIIALGVAMYSAFENGKSGARDFVDKLNKGLNPNSPDSIQKHYDTLIAKHTELVKNLQKPVGKDFWSIDGFTSAVSQVGKNMADLTTNVAGIDLVKDSSWDQAFKVEELTKTEKKMMTHLHNIQKNATEVFHMLYPQFPKQKGTLLGVGDDELRFISRVAEQAKINLTDAFGKSAPQRQAAADEIRRITGMMGAMGVTAANATPEMIKQFAEINKAAGKAGKGAGDAFAKSFDLFKSVDPKKTFDDIFKNGDATLIPVQDQIKSFYDTSLTTAQKFYDGISELQKRGANPAVIQKMLQAGPEAAGAVVQAAVDDTTGGVIATLNAGEKALQGFSARAIELARLTQLAISSGSDKLANELGQGMQIANEKLAQGTGATVESVASAIGMSPADAERIAGDFGITLAHNLKPDQFIPAGGLAQFNTPLKSMKQELNDTAAAITAFSDTSPSTVISIVGNLGKVLAMPAVKTKDITDKRIATEELFRMVDQIPNSQDKQVVMKIIGDEIAKGKVSDFLKTVMGQSAGTKGGMPSFEMGRLSQTQIDFVLSVLGQPDAVQQITAFADSVKMVPEDKATLLRLTGIPEGIAEADKIDGAIAALHGADLPITADNVDAILKAANVDEAINNLKGKELNITANDMASTVIDDVLMKLIGLDGKSATVQVYAQQQIGALDNAFAGQFGYAPTRTSALGNIFTAYARGGMENHVAQIAGGNRMRMWAEPETGGEAYIPLAKSKRRRSARILDQVAGMFGLEVSKPLRFASGGVYNDSAVSTYVDSVVRSQNWQTLYRNSTGAANAAEASAGSTDFYDAVNKINDRFNQMSQTLLDVEKAAGKTAAQQLANSGLVGKAFDDLGAKLIENGNKAKQAFQGAFDSISGAIRKLENVTSAFGKGTEVTASNIMDYYNQMAKGSQEFAGRIQDLANMGLNSTTLNDLLSQGPDALNVVRAILQGGQSTVNSINASVNTIDQTANQVGRQFAIKMANATAPTDPSWGTGIDLPKAPVSISVPTIPYDKGTSISTGNISISFQQGAPSMSTSEFHAMITTAFTDVVDQITQGV